MEIEVYTVECEQEPAAPGGARRRWLLKGPCIADALIFTDMWQARHEATRLNDAYNAGVAEGLRSAKALADVRPSALVDPLIPRTYAGAAADVLGPAPLDPFAPGDCPL